MTFARPLSSAFLQEPQSHHVLEKAGRAEDPTLIREIGGESPGGYDWTRELDAHQRPGTRADIAPASWQRHRCGRNRRTGIVRRRRDYPRCAEIALPFWQDFAQRCSCFDN